MSRCAAAAARSVYLTQSSVHGPPSMSSFEAFLATQQLLRAFEVHANRCRAAAYRCLLLLLAALRSGMLAI